MAEPAFKTWLKEKLRSLQTDENVFCEYIVGILDSDETTEEKSEGLEAILGAIDSDVVQLAAEIMRKWNECHPSEGKTDKEPTIDVNEHLAKLLESQKIESVHKDKELTAEERRIKEQILAQYSMASVTDDEDGEEEEDDAETRAGGGGGGGGSSSGLPALEKNTNVQNVIQLQKERREQARLDSAAKKQKDKEDREKQKKLREEKKEKRKTVKGERRR